MTLMTLTINLSWPPSELWPNSRKNFMVKDRAAREARHKAYMLTRIAMGGHGFAYAGGTVNISIVGHKPNKRKRDLQNLKSALKAAVDGIADALHVDDANFVLTTRWGDPHPLRGSVTVEIGE